MLFRSAALSGGVYDKLLQEVIADAKDFSYYNSVPDIVAALKALVWGQML